MAKMVPAYYRACKAIPAFMKGAVAAVAKPFMKKIAQAETYGTLHWHKTKDKDRISAYYGDIDKWNKIGTWDDIDIRRPSEEVVLLDHGYDESKPLGELDIGDMQGAAAFRGGKCLSETMEKGDLYTPLRWQCAFGHEFTGSPNLILRMGHWCPHCLTKEWNYYEQAKVNPFFAQVWDYAHEDEEPFSVKMECDTTVIDKCFAE